MSIRDLENSNRTSSRRCISNSYPLEAIETRRLSVVKPERGLQAAALAQEVASHTEHDLSLLSSLEHTHDPRRLSINDNTRHQSLEVERREGQKGS